MIEKAVISLSAWFLFVGLFFFSFGLWPRTLVGWLVSVAFGPIIFAAAQIVGELGLERFHSLPGIRSRRKRVLLETRGMSFSLRRVRYQLGEILLVLCVLLSVVFLLRWLAGTSLAPAIDFLRQHFRWA